MAMDPKSLKNLRPFPPGVSGNPAGAPKGKRWKTVFRDLLEQRALVPTPTSKKGKAERKLLEQFEKKIGRPLTNRDAVAFSQYLKAVSGDTAAARWIAEREEGRPAIEGAEDTGEQIPDVEMTPENMKELLKIARGEE